MSKETLRQGLAISFLVTALAGCETSTLNQPAPSANANAPGTPGPSTEISALTAQILDAAGSLENSNTPSVQQSPQADRLRSLIKTRAELLSRLASIDPAHAIGEGMSDSQRSRIPTWARRCLERPLDEAGTVDVLAIDRENTAEISISMTGESGARYQLHFGDNTPDLQTGAQVRVRGLHIPCGPGSNGDATEDATVADDAHGSGCRQDAGGECISDAVAVQSGERDVSALAVASAHPSIGEQNTAVILVNFSDRANALTNAKVTDLVFNQGSAYMREASFGKTWLSGQVFGPYTIASSASSCNSSTIETQAKAAASAAGVSLTGYKRYLYVFPYTTVCGWSGLGTIGGNPSKSWVNGVTVLRTYVHELGHNYGLYHSNALNCGTTASIGNNCSVIEYGDTTDVMGKLTAHYNAYQKERITWIGASAPAGSPAVAAVTASGTYAIESYETNSFNPKALKILKSVNASTGAKTYYYVEFRQPQGFDAVFTSSSTVSNNLTRSVAVHTGNDSVGREIYLINMNPQSSSWYQAGLNVGQTYEDPAAGVAIQLASYSPAGAVVNVIVPGSAPACTHADPTVTLSAPNSGSVQAGIPVTYTLSVRNNDSVGCTTADFDLSAEAPNNEWNLSQGSTRIAGLSPGASASSTVQVTSPINTTAGSYTINASATNAADAAYGASASATYSVAPVATQLNVALTTNQAIYSRGQYIAMGIYGPAGGSYRLTINRPDGTSSVRTGTIGSSGNVKYSFSTQYALRGSYTARVTITLGNGTGTASRTYSIQ